MGDGRAEPTVSSTKNSLMLLDESTVGRTQENNDVHTPLMMSRAPPLPRSTQGDGKAALKGVYRASLRLSRPGALRFCSGLFLHLAADTCFTILEQVIIR